MSGKRRKHILLIPFPAFGHYSPFLELARKVHEYHDVTLAVSSFKEADIRQRDLLPPAGTRFLPIQDQLDINFDLGFDPKTYMTATKSMKPHYDALLEALTGNRANTSSRPYVNVPSIDAVIIDSSFYILSEVWGQFGIPVYNLCPYSATLFEKGLRFDVNTPTVPDEYFFDGSREDVTSGKAIPESVKAMTIALLNGRKYVQKVLFNSFDQLEGDAMRDMVGHPTMGDASVHFIGPLVPQDNYINSDTGAVEHRVEVWLDKQRTKSVVYASFGSLATPSAEQLNELGEALLSLGRPFIWPLRPFQQRHLPERFLRVERNSFAPDAPYLILPWVPQKGVLKHPATAVFVSHCGWNSTLEAVSYGVPVVAWPMFGDQHLNAAVLQEKELARILDVQGMKSPKVVSAEKIRKAIEATAGWDGGEAGEKFAKGASKYAALARQAVGPHGSSTKNFVELMRTL